VFALGLTQWQHVDLGLFLGYLIVSSVAASLRIKLPGLAGALSLHFFFVLICIPHLSLPEVMIIAAAGATIQCIAFLKPPRALAIAFDVAVAVTASGVTAWVFQTMAAGKTSAPILYVVAASVLFLGYSIPPAIAMALAEDRSVIHTWRNDFLWTFPHYIAGGGAAGLLSLIGNRTGWETTLLIVPVIYWMYNSYRYYLQTLDAERRQARDVGGLHFRTIEALSLAIEGHDPTKHGHLRRVSIYTTEIGRYMGLPESELQALYTAAMLHDIGKLAVPEHIITKPGKLTDIEFERMKIHAVAGAEILEQVQFPYPVAPVVRAHHERWNGTGYPLGLKGTEIPIGARILAAVDCLDALVSDRYHRRAMSLDDAIDRVRAESGTSFDPEVVALLSAHYREFEDMVQAAEQRDLQTAVPADQFAMRALTKASDGAAFLSRIAAARLEEQQFSQLAHDLGNTLSLDKTLESCAARVRVMCPCDSVVIFLVSHHERNISPAHAWGAFSEYLATARVTWGKGVAGCVMDQGSPLLNADPAAELAGCGAQTAAELRSALAVPIDGAAGRIGVITLYSRAKNAFTADHLRILSGVAARVSGAIENAIRYSQAERSAATDVLTGLANARSLFFHLDVELARARRNHESVTVLMCDLDRFKQLNDNHGHMAGNRALQLIAQALKKQCREYDFVARMGGDEFVLVMPSHRTVSVDGKIEQLQQAVANAVTEIPGGSALGISIGHASFPQDGSDADALLAAADKRMYRMKQRSTLKSVDSTSEELQRLGEKLAARSATMN
jgi:diguanylate cyclase (GGDEF)-like protein/putative nucleotidyltransferase with HDIG domain